MSVRRLPPFWRVRRARWRPVAFVLALAASGSVLGLGTAIAQVENQAPIGKFNLISINNAPETATPNVVVRGFALDPDSTASIAVRVFRNDTRLYSITANKPRPAIGAKYDLGPDHGITTVVPLVPGTNEICIEALDVDFTAPTAWLGCRTVVVSDVPIGEVDPIQTTSGTSRSLIISGVVRDSEYNGRVGVHIYIDGTYAGAAATARRTSRFITQLPAEPGTHEVCLWAIATPPVSLGCQDVSVPDQELGGSALPVGSMNPTRSPGTISVAGFAVDADTIDPVRVRFEVNGATRAAIYARRINTSLHERLGRGDRHAYRLTMQVPAGQHELCGFIADADTDAERALGCRTITVPD
ncbi:MAG: hypothetical protein HKN26_16380 [Acidimicrobiales bacterium]|nr:hypothetical protein [Acidimicrobiales bacterium]